MDDVTTFERNLTARLQAHLGPRRPVDAHAIATIAVAGAHGPIEWPWRTRISRRYTFSTPSRSIVWLAASLALLTSALLLAFFIGRQPPPPPQPTQSPAPTGSALASGSPLPSGPTYFPIVVRDDGQNGVDVYMALPDGSEQLVRHVPMLNAADIDTLQPDVERANVLPYGSVSVDGWLAISVEFVSSSVLPDSRGSPALALIDLKDPSRKPWVIYWTGIPSPVWGQTGLLALSGFSAGSTQFVDPDAHARRTFRGGHAVGGGPTVLWAADGSGLVGYRDDSGEARGPDDFAVFPPDGSDPIVGLVQIDASTTTRSVGADQFALCNNPLFRVGSNSACQRHDLIAATPGGERKEWDATTLPPGVVDDVSFAADGRGLWVVVENPSSSNPFTLSRFDSLDSSRVVAAVQSDVVSPRGPDAQPVSFRGLAPDDSIVIVSDMYIPTDGTSPHVHDGLFAGFVPSAVADDFASRADEVLSAPPSSTALPLP